MPKPYTVYTYIDTPLGQLLVAQTEAGVSHVRFMNRTNALQPPKDWTYKATLSGDVVEQLHGYFAGSLFTFDVPLAPLGTPFQQRVWQALLAVPYGKTCSYADIAQQLGNPKAVRAVGAANGRNPVAILIPCHRVIGRDGRLTGYAGGLSTKAYLLDLEQTHQPEQGSQFKLF